jgi:hypothetical protein
MTRAIEQARDLNRRSRQLAPAATDEPSPFFCECADDRCYVTVWLTPDRYDELVADGKLVLASGHDAPELNERLLQRLRQPPSQT